MEIILPWVGFCFTIAGSFMLAFGKWQGFIAFMIANILWALVALATGQIALLAQMIVLNIPAMVGIIRKAAK